MYVVVKCPNLDCQFHHKPQKGSYVKRGYFSVAKVKHKIPKYQCKGCGKYFSSHTGTKTYRVRRPHLDHDIIKLHCSGVPIRRIAKILGMGKKTVSDRLRCIAELCEKYHKDYLAYGLLDINQCVFDELEDKEQVKFKPLSIAIAVAYKNKRNYILDAQVFSIPPRNVRGTPSRDYQWQNNSEWGLNSFMRNLKRCISPRHKCLFITDGDTTYPALIRRHFPFAEHKQIILRRVYPAEEQLYVKMMNNLNHQFAELRQYQARLKRKTWATTKQSAFLQASLYIYICWFNRYDLDAILKGKSPENIWAEREELKSKRAA